MQRNDKNTAKKYNIHLSKQEIETICGVIKKNSNEYKKIIDGMHKNKTMQEIANSIKKTKQAIHVKIKKLYLTIEKKEEIGEIIKDFDTYLNINKNIEIKMEDKKIKIEDITVIIKKLLLYKMKNAFEIRDNRGDIYIIDKKLHFKIITSKNVVSKLIQSIKKHYSKKEFDKLKYYAIAKELKLDEERLKDILKIFYKDKLFFIEPYVLPIRKNGVFTAVDIYVEIINSKKTENEEDVIMEIEKTIRIFMEEYKKEFFNYGISSKEELIDYLKTRKDLALSCFLK